MALGRSNLSIVSDEHRNTNLFLVLSAPNALMWPVALASRRSIPTIPTIGPGSTSMRDVHAARHIVSLAIEK